jgi:hypothetical protein
MPTSCDFQGQGLVSKANKTLGEEKKPTQEVTYFDGCVGGSPEASTEASESGQ